jgi:endonuclease/exonuclease/phosphatase family metal-dependent hydrolase
MKFVTFNIRCDHGQDGDNCFDNRKSLILRKFAQENPDIICFQEVLPHVALWLKNNLTDYLVFGCGRGVKMDSEQMTIAVRRDSYQLLEVHTYWLSETPDVPGSIYPGQSSCPRICTDAVLMEDASGQVFRVLNTHLDHVSAKARKLGLMQVLKYTPSVKAFAEAPVILAGDFNAEPDSEEMAPLFENPDLTVATTDTGITYHGYGMAPHPTQIDYIVTRGALRCGKAQKWEDMENGVYLSDHYPVCCEITFEQ